MALAQDSRIFKEQMSTKKTQTNNQFPSGSICPNDNPIISLEKIDQSESIFQNQMFRYLQKQ